MTRPICPALCASLIALAALPAAVQGQEETSPRAAAAEAYDRGTEAYLAGDFERAAHWFETAHRMAPAAPALVQALRAYTKVPDDGKAGGLALRVIEEYPEDEDAVAYAQQVLDEVQPQLFRVEVQCEGCAIELDGKVQDHHTFFVEPDSPHEVVASFDTGERRETVEGPAGEATIVSFEAPPAAQSPPSEREGGPPGAPAPKAPRDSEGWSPLVTYIGLGLTGALGAAAIASGIDTNAGVEEYERLAEECDRGQGPAQSCERAEELLDEGQSKETRTNILIGATAVSAAATLAIAVVFTDWSAEDDASPEVGLSLVPTATGALAQVKGRF